ncbi:macrophage mannose receptor 1-like [Hemibagrus wyckioides]|uniref:macrophage mannose receptor 1-like n=1 Tax=Hemibagrus wyckioides TaxID=337641 RepID=UPI00266CA1BB|nr:macrophage mannose receptor 1-like [Hemibagrus wyckioides]
MAVLSILVLLALTDAATGLLWKNHIHYQANMSWTDAQTYCRSHEVDLSVFVTERQFNLFANHSAGMSGWIGLRKKEGETTFTMWSDGSILEYTKWKDGQPDKPDTEDCVFTGSEWEDGDCTNVNNFFCYTWTPRLFVVQEMMNWEEALVHCRTHYTDLVSLDSELDYFVVNSRRREIVTPTFWTSLRFMDGSWFWVNHYWVQTTLLPSCPAKPFRCGAWNIKAGVWQNRDCEEKMNFICYDYI